MAEDRPNSEDFEVASRFSSESFSKFSKDENSYEINIEDFNYTERDYTKRSGPFSIFTPYRKEECSMCYLCEEHCPTPDKAIKFDIKEITLPDGSSRRVKYPYVVRNLCIGCSICETKCPLPGVPGIFITTENEKRFKKS